MARTPKRKAPPGVRVTRGPHGHDGPPTLALDAGQVTAIIELRVVIAGPMLFGTGSIRGDHGVHPKLQTVGPAMAEDFQVLMRAIAAHLDCEVVDLGAFQPVDGAPIVTPSRPGRA